MPLQPDPPFPKTRGNAIRAKDWNDTVNEMVRLDQTKLNSTGGAVSGNLTVGGNLSANGTISGNLAANIVGSSQLADGVVRSQHIFHYSLTVEKLIGSLAGRNFEFTMGAGGTSGLYAGGVSRPECPLVFFSAFSPDRRDVLVEHSIAYSEIPGTGGNLVAQFRNRSSGSVTVRTTIFILSI
jgi:hypothetical protein